LGLFALDRFLAKASTCIYLLAVCHSSFCSNGPAPTGRAIRGLVREDDADSGAAFHFLVKTRDGVG